MIIIYLCQSESGLWIDRHAWTISRSNTIRDGKAQSGFVGKEEWEKRI